MLLVSWKRDGAADVEVLCLRIHLMCVVVVKAVIIIGVLQRCGHRRALLQALLLALIYIYKKETIW